VIFIDRPATILILIVVVGSLAATEATEIIGVVVVRKAQWLTWFPARHGSSHNVSSTGTEGARSSSNSPAARRVPRAVTNN
jgi:hypothetical protein